MKISEQLIEHSEDVKEYIGRYPYFYTGVVIAFIILFGRLWYLQIVKGNEFKRFSENNQIKSEKIPAPRGMFLDRDGKLLVDNAATFNVLLTPQYIVSLDRAAKDLGTILKLKPEDIVEKVRSSRKQNGAFKPVIIKANISRDEVIRVERMRIDTPGLSVEMGIRRNYLLGENAAQLFGYTAEISKEELPVLNSSKGQRFKAGDIIGKTGLEKRWDTDVRGSDGARFVEVDAKMREVATGEGIGISGYPEGQDYVPGRNVTLTLDRDLQEATYNAFLKNNRIGSAVALDPNNGEILAFVNLPSFDPNHFATSIPRDIWTSLINDPFKPLRNKIIQDPVPPGSTFKAIVALAALQEKVIKPSTTYFCPGFLQFGKRPYHCHIKQGHGYVNIYQALERSCDVFFYQVGLTLGIDRIAKYARYLGLGTKTGIMLDNERSGLIPDSRWKKEIIGEEWQAGENLSNAIGQGFTLTTALQLAKAYGMIGTLGKSFRPHIVKTIHNMDGTPRVEFQPEQITEIGQPNADGTVISKENFEIVKEGLHQVFNGPRGTAQAHKVVGLEMAGKTGTAQLFQLTKETVYMKCENRPFKQRHHGWLVAFAPRDNPKIVVAVHTEHSCHGTSSGPIVKEMMLSYFRKHYPDLLKKYDERNPVAPVPNTEVIGDE